MGYLGNDTDTDVLIAVINNKNVTDEQWLVNNFALHDDWEVRGNLAHRLTDKQLIEDYLADDEDIDVLIAVINNKNITDEQWLVDKFAKHSNEKISQELDRRLSFIKDKK